MSKQFSADSEGNNEIKGSKGKSQAQLLVLLLLIAAGAYVYFFTGLIKPREEASAPPPQPAQVKKPMPPRQPDQKADPAGAKPEQVASAAPAPTPAAPKAVAPAVAPATPAGAPKPAVQAPAKPQVPASSQPLKTAKAEPAAAKAVVKPAPATAGKAGDTKNGKEAVTAKPADNGATSADKQAKAPVKAAPAAGKKAELTTQKKTPAGAFMLKTADLAFERDVVRTEAKLKKAGIKPVALHKITKAEPMNRLFYGEYPNRESAAADLDQLKSKAPDAFMVQEEGKFVIYAGSYLKEGRGAIEQDRLFDKGLRLVMKKTQVKIPVTYITAGSFASEEEARNAAARLKKSGVVVAVANSAPKSGRR